MKDLTDSAPPLVLSDYCILSHLAIDFVVSLLHLDAGRLVLCFLFLLFPFRVVLSSFMDCCINGVSMGISPHSFSINEIIEFQDFVNTCVLIRIFIH